MKFGKSYQERWLLEKKWREVGKIEETKFAFLPILCSNTDRTVWLESVIRIREWSDNWCRVFTTYKEIL